MGTAVSKLGSALHHAQLGWYIFPVGTVDGGAKRPLVRWGEQATCDIDRILHWWKRWPDANPAVATKPSRLVVFDCDVIKPGDTYTWPDEWANMPGVNDGADVLVEIFLRNNAGDLTYLNQTRKVRTGSGGVHWYFEAPPDNGITNSQGGRFAPKVDIRAAGGDYGGYALLPDSTSSNGARYVLEQDVDPWPLPSWLDKLCRTKAAQDLGRIAGPGASVAGVRRGGGASPLDDWEVMQSIGRIMHKLQTDRMSTQNKLLYWAACELRDLGCNEDYAAVELWQVVATWENRDPNYPWTSQHVVDSVRSAFRKGRQPRRR